LLYPWLDWQRSLVSAWLEAGRLASVSSPFQRLLHPPRELLARTLAAGEVSRRSLEEVVRRDAPFPVKGQAIAETPFVRLVHLHRPGVPQRHRFLLLAPNSGYTTAVLSPLATTLASMGEVIVTDWVDARLAPLAEGRFGLEEQIATAMAAACALGGPAHLLALSQSGPVALALAARLVAEAPELAPASLAFLGCQLDPNAAHTPLQRLLEPWPRDVLAQQLTTTVGPGYPGAGRRVYPAVLQLLAYSLASPQLYAEVQHGLLRELVVGAAGIYARQHADLHSLLDVPGELFVDMLDWMVGEAVWQEDRPVIAGEPHDLAGLRRVPLLTLESAEDELVGAGQTHALARRLGAARARAVTLKGGRHHDLFTGPGFLAGTASTLRSFYGALDT
jgi:poly(3-hydroxybutyrate) depolymerase